MKKDKTTLEGLDNWLRSRGMVAKDLTDDEFVEWWIEGIDEKLGFNKDKKEEDDFDYYRQRIIQTCDGIKELLLRKNADYGNSAFNSVELFGRTISPTDAILCRIGDKIKRLSNVGILDKEDDNSNNIDDLIGYLTILKIVIEDEKDKEI